MCSSGCLIVLCHNNIDKLMLSGCLTMRFTTNEDIEMVPLKAYRNWLVPSEGSNPICLLSCRHVHIRKICEINIMQF